MKTTVFWPKFGLKSLKTSKNKTFSIIDFEFKHLYIKSIKTIDLSLKLIKNLSFHRFRVTFGQFLGSFSAFYLKWRDGEDRYSTYNYCYYWYWSRVEVKDSRGNGIVFIWISDGLVVAIESPFVRLSHQIEDQHWYTDCGHSITDIRVNMKRQLFFNERHNTYNNCQ